MNLRMNMQALALIGAMLLGAQAGKAQHFDVFVGRPVSGAQTAYGAIDVDTAAITLSQRVFEAEMGEEPFDGTFLSDEPGFNHPADDAALPPGVTSLVSGDEIFVSALPLIVNSQSSTLFYWNGVSPVAFAPAVGTTFSIDTGNMTGSIGAAGAGGSFDDHPFFVLDDGDAMAATFPTPGIYLASFQAAVADLEPTDPLYLVMGTEGLITAEFLGIDQAEFELLTDEELDEALEEVIEMGVDWVERNVAVPEPSSLGLLALSAICAAGRFRSRPAQRA